MTSSVKGCHFSAIVLEIGLSRSTMKQIAPPITAMDHEGSPYESRLE